MPKTRGIERYFRKYISFNAILSSHVKGFGHFLLDYGTARVKIQVKKDLAILKTKSAQNPKKATKLNLV